jgi:hypothetical protein
VISAHESIALYTAVRQREAPVCAAVVKGHDLTVVGSPQDDIAIQQPPT